MLGQAVVIARNERRREAKSIDTTVHRREAVADADDEVHDTTHHEAVRNHKVTLQTEVAMVRNVLRSIAERRNRAQV